MGEVRGGSMNWLEIGGFTIQPSELVKVCYIYAGAATLDRLFARRNLFGYIVFSAVCVCALALMGDFGTAVIFFATFLVVSFMRSGSFATVLLAVSGAGLAGFLVLSVKPYIAQRSASLGHGLGGRVGRRLPADARHARRRLPAGVRQARARAG